MDVVCGRCRAEYEFDNALISERGTTVRCTSCGLQFKIFPPLGQRAVELWRVFRAEHLDQPVLEYASLEELQRGIAAATVRRTDWLARGDDGARPLAEILELQPLLGQRNSERPPAVEELGPDAPGIKAVLRLGSSGTVIGMPPTEDEDIAAPDATPPPAPLMPEVDEPGSQVTVGELSSDAHNALVEKWVETAGVDDDAAVMVPSLLPEETPDEGLTEQAERSREELVPAAGSESLGHLPRADRQDVPRRKVRSALSHTSAVSSAAVRPQRASLLARTRIGGSHSIEPEPPSSGRRAASYPPPLPEDAPESPQVTQHVQDVPDSVPDVDPVAAGAQAAPIPASAERAEHAPSVSRLTPVTSPHVAASSNTQPRPQPKARPTPQKASPPASRGSSPNIHRERPSVHRDEMTSTPGTPPRKATFSVVIVLVLATAGGFLVWSQIKSPELTSRSPDTPRAKDAVRQPAVTTRPPSASLLTRLADLEAAWWINLLKRESTVSLGDAVWTELSPSLNPGPSWERVNLLRLSGKLRQAREVAMQLSTTGADYALSALDLIDTDHPPWALLSRRFKDASVGETAPYLARVGLIYSLAEQGSILAARAEYENLSKMQGATKSTLFNELGAFLQRTEPESGTEAAAASTGNTPSSSASIELTPAPSSAPLAPQAPATPAAASTVASTPKTSVPDEEVKKKKDVPAAVKAKVDQADQLWRSGDRDGAVVLYRQVVSQIGTSHFLGQRSAARIAQAAREAGSGEPQ